MKKITSIALVLLMSLQCFYKLGVITYFHLNQEYIAEVLCVNKEEPITMCYGQCFLNKNLNLADESTPDGTLPIGKQKLDFPVFLISQNAYQFHVESKPDDVNSLYIKGSTADYSSVPFHPPALLL